MIEKKQWTLWIFVTLAVIVIYHICYGMSTLYPSNINWLMAIRHDWGTHYLGWAFFKDEPWHFPLGKVTGYNYPVGTNVGFTDSIPLLAIFLKIFSKWLPSDFQYFGVWLFICHLLTAYFTVLLCKHFRVNAIITFAAAIFVTTNPVLVFRALHPALCAQWLLIACIYFYFLDQRTVGVKKILFYQLTLLILSALINPYLCWMVLGFSFCTPVKLCFLEKALEKKYFLGYILLSLFLLVFVWYITGMIELEKKEDLAVGGSYGLYALNLNALFNSSGYSTIFPARKLVSSHQYEGYMYLGAGMLILLFVLLLYYVFDFVKLKTRQAKGFQKASAGTKTWIPLLVLAAVYAIFSITLVFTFNDKVLFSIPAPSFFKKMIEIFRANSRFFWMPYYLIFIFIIIGLAKTKLKLLVKYALIFGALFIQLYDIKPLLTSRRNITCCTYMPPMDHQNWIKLMSYFDEILFFPAFTSPGIHSMAYQDFSYLALKAGKPINLAYVARADSRAMQRFTDSLAAKIDSGKLSTKALYIVNASHLDYFSLAFQMNEARLNILDGCYYVFSSSLKNDTLDAVVGEGNLRDKAKLDSTWNSVGIRTEFVETAKVLTKNNNSIRNNPESIQITDQMISMLGWAFIDTTDNNKGDSIYVTLTSNNRSYIARAKTFARDDMVTFGKTYLNDAGFKFLAFTDNVPKGIYQVGLAIKNVEGLIAYQPIGREMKVKISEYEYPLKTETLKATGKINFDIQVDDKESEFFAGGWAAIENQDADESTIYLVLKSNRQTYLCATQNSPRPDVTAYFKNKYKLDNSGFAVKILKSGVEKGKYKLGILIKDKSRNVEYVVFSDKEISVQ